MTNRLILAVALAGMTALPAMAQDDLVAEGEKVFKRCAACHKIGEGAKNGVGPSLNGVIGRPAGDRRRLQVLGSDAGSRRGRPRLGRREPDGLSSGPEGAGEGHEMAFAGLKSEEDRQAVIAYMAANGGN